MPHDKKKPSQKTKNWKRILPIQSQWALIKINLKMANSPTENKQGTNTHMKIKSTGKEP